MPVDGAGDHFFAGAAFAGQQDGGAAVAHRVDGLQDTTKTRAFTHQAVYVLVFIEFGAHARVITHDVAKLKGFADSDVELVDVEGFGDVVVGTVTHRLHGVFHRAVGGHHDHRQLRVAHFDFGQ